MGREKSGLCAQAAEVIEDSEKPVSGSECEKSGLIESNLDRITM